MNVRHFFRRNRRLNPSHATKLWQLNRWQLLLIEQRIREIESIIEEISGFAPQPQPWPPETRPQKIDSIRIASLEEAW